MRILTLSLLLFLSIPLWAQTAPKMATKLTAYWTAAGACPNSCVTGYTLSITPPSGTAVVIPLASTVTSYIWTPGGNLSYGAYAITITTNVTSGVTATPPSTFHLIYASGVSTGTAPGGFAIRYTQ